MAAAKKTVKPVAVAAPATAPKTEAKKVETPAVEVKAEVKKVETPAAKAAVKEAKTAPAKKETKPAAKQAPAKKVELKSEVHVQFAGKSYTEEDLVKIAKDVWKYDLKQKVSDLASVELYVKPEEQTVYYVMNKEFTGSFTI
jgi:hypothetical protein